MIIVHLMLMVPYQNIKIDVSCSKNSELNFIACSSITVLFAFNIAGANAKVMSIIDKKNYLYT